MADPWTKTNLVEVEDAAPANGFGGRWEARVASVPTTRPTASRSTTTG